MKTIFILLGVFAISACAELMIAGIKGVAIEGTKTAVVISESNKKEREKEQAPE